MIIVLSILVLLTGSCVDQLGTETSELQVEDTNSGNKRIPAGAAASKPPSLGKLIWNNSCKSCHTNGSSGYPNKIYATKSDIRNGLNNINSMKPLKDIISDEDIDALWDYLNSEVVQEIMNNKSEVKVNSIATVGTAGYVSSKLSTIYTSGTGSSNVATLRNIINYINENPGAFGGTCVFEQDTCVGTSTSNRNTSMNAQSNVLRRGIMIKVCQELHSHDEARENVFRYGDISDLTLKNSSIDHFINLYIPGHKDNDDELRNHLREIYLDAVNNGLSDSNAWNILLYTLCISPLGEVI